MYCSGDEVTSKRELLEQQTECKNGMEYINEVQVLEAVFDRVLKLSQQVIKLYLFRILVHHFALIDKSGQSLLVST